MEVLAGLQLQPCQRVRRFRPGHLPKRAERKPEGSQPAVRECRVREPPERRKSIRFNIVRELNYRTLGKRTYREAGIGVTINISSGGVLFASEHTPDLGQRLELCISWPMRLDNRLGLNLIVRGQVVRREVGLTAVRIIRYEFRTHAIGVDPRDN